MLAAYCSANNQKAQTAASVIIGSQGQKQGGLISSNTSLLSSDGDYSDTCSFFGEPSDAAIMAFCESAESTGAIAYYGGETSGSIAYGGGETSGSIASSSCGGSSFSGGGCSFTC